MNTWNMLGGKSHRITEWYTPFQTSEVAVNEAKMKHRKESKQMANLLLHDDRRLWTCFPGFCCCYPSEVGTATKNG
jgi:hypothetical protein